MVCTVPFIIFVLLEIYCFKEVMKVKVVLVLLGITSILIIAFTQFIWNSVPEFWLYGAEIGNVLFNLSIGYLSAFIFYIIDIWIPGLQKRKRVNFRVKMPLNRIVSFMEAPLVNIVKRYGEDSKNINTLSSEEFKEITERIDLINDQGDLFFIDANRNANFGEYLYYHVENVEEYINSILKMPFEYEIELLELLDQIERSKYHEMLNSIKNLSGFRGPVQAKGEAISNTVYEYYYLCSQLKKYMNKQGILE